MKPVERAMISRLIEECSQHGHVIEIDAMHNSVSVRRYRGGSGAFVYMRTLERALRSALEYLGIEA